MAFSTWSFAVLRAIQPLIQPFIHFHSQASVFWLSHPVLDLITGFPTLMFLYGKPEPLESST